MRAGMPDRMSSREVDVADRTEDRLRRIEDRIEIEELLAHYVFAADELRFEDLASLFCRDGEFRSSDGVLSVRGREDIVAFFNRMSPPGTFQYHVVHQISITPDTQDDDLATGTNGGHVEFIRAGVPEVGAYHYDDVYAREDGRWRLKTRSVRMFYLVSLDSYRATVVGLAPVAGGPKSPGTGQKRGEN